MSSYGEVRRVRAEMSAATGHDVRKLIAQINQRRPEAASRIIDPGTEAEQSATSAPVEVQPAESKPTVVAGR